MLLRASQEEEEEEEEDGEEEGAVEADPHGPGADPHLHHPDLLHHPGQKIFENNILPLSEVSFLQGDLLHIHLHHQELQGDQCCFYQTSRVSLSRSKSVC